MANNARFLILYGGQSLAIDHQGGEVAALLEFLFQDVATVEAEPRSHLQINETVGGWSLASQSAGYRSNADSLIDLALPLMNTVLLQLTQGNPDRIHLRAAAISDDRGTVLFAGMPGSGKSTVALELCRQGYHYHGDELVSLAPGSRDVASFTRPLVFRRGLFEKLYGAEMWVREFPSSTCIVSAANVWIPHRLINSDYRRRIPSLRAIVFPRFEPGLPPSLTAFSAARSGMRLMQSQFKSGTHDDHGFHGISDLVRVLPVYEMCFQRPGEVAGLLEQI